MGRFRHASRGNSLGSGRLHLIRFIRLLGRFFGQLAIALQIQCLQFRIDLVMVRRRRFIRMVRLGIRSTIAPVFHLLKLRIGVTVMHAFHFGDSLLHPGGYRR